jgi:hypothetical protein
MLALCHNYASDIIFMIIWFSNFNYFVFIVQSLGSFFLKIKLDF